MGENSFPELDLSTKRVIFWSLVLLFVGYSGLIYTTGTNYMEGEGSYTESAQKGKFVFHKHNCISCHQIYGLGGYMGPDLTNVMSSQGKGRSYASAFIVSGTAKMPKFDLSEEETENLLDYLEYVSQAGDYPITDFESTWYGDVSPNSVKHE